MNTLHPGQVDRQTRWLSGAFQFLLVTVLLTTCAYGREYRVFDSPSMSYSNAETFCRSRNGWVAIFANSKSWSTFRRLYPVLTSTSFGGTQYWIGASDRSQEGTWRWSSQGNPLASQEAGLGKTFFVKSTGLCSSGMFCNWAPAEPNDGFFGGEDRAVMYLGATANTGQWNDVWDNANADGVICQFPTTRSKTLIPTESLSLLLSATPTITPLIETPTLTLTSTSPLTTSQTVSLSRLTESSSEELSGSQTLPMTWSPSKSQSISPPLPLPQGACPWALFYVAARYTVRSNISNAPVLVSVPVAQGDLVWLDSVVVNSTWVLSSLQNSTSGTSESWTNGINPALLTPAPAFVVPAPPPTPMNASSNGTKQNGTTAAPITTTSAPTPNPPTTAAPPKMFILPPAPGSPLPNRLNATDWRWFDDVTFDTNKSFAPTWHINLAQLRTSSFPYLVLSMIPRSCQRFRQQALRHVGVNFSTAPGFAKIHQDIVGGSNGTSSLFRWLLPSLKEVQVSMTMPIPRTFYLFQAETITFTIADSAMEGGFETTKLHRFYLHVEPDRAWKIPSTLTSTQSGGTGVVKLGSGISGSGGAINAAQRGRLLNAGVQCPMAINEFDYEFTDDILGFRIPGLSGPFVVHAGVAIGNGFIIIGAVIVNILFSLLVYLGHYLNNDAEDLSFWDALAVVRFPGRAFTVGLIGMPPALIACLTILLQSENDEVPLWLWFTVAGEAVFIFLYFLLLPLYVVVLSPRLKLSVGEFFFQKKVIRQRNCLLRFIRRQVDWVDIHGTCVSEERTKLHNQQRKKCCAILRPRQQAFSKILRHCGHFFDDNVSGAKEFSMIETLGSVATAAITASFPATEDQCMWRYIVIMVLMGSVFFAALVTRPYATLSMNCFMIPAYLLQFVSSILLWRAYAEESLDYAKYTSILAIVSMGFMLAMLAVEIGMITVSTFRKGCDRWKRRNAVVQPIKTSGEGNKGLAFVALGSE